LRKWQTGKLKSVHKRSHPFILWNLNIYLKEREYWGGEETASKLYNFCSWESIPNLRINKSSSLTIPETYPTGNRITSSTYIFNHNVSNLSNNAIKLDYFHWHHKNQGKDSFQRWHEMSQRFFSFNTVHKTTYFWRCFLAFGRELGCSLKIKCLIPRT
jgi:hypothetical protein